MVQNKYYTSHYQSINMVKEMASSLHILLQIYSPTSEDKQRTQSYLTLYLWVLATEIINASFWKYFPNISVKQWDKKLYLPCTYVGYWRMKNTYVCNISEVHYDPTGNHYTNSTVLIIYWLTYKFSTQRAPILKLNAATNTMSRWKASKIKLF